jgi:hypothetical protein
VHMTLWGRDRQPRIPGRRQRLVLLVLVTATVTVTIQTVTVAHSLKLQRSHREERWYVARISSRRTPLFHGAYCLLTICCPHLAGLAVAHVDEH